MYSVYDLMMMMMMMIIIIIIIIIVIVIIWVFLYAGLSWKTGDLVWAKSMNWPSWPAIIFHDRSGSYKNNDSIHVLFVDIIPTTAWVNSKYVLQIVLFVCTAYYIII